jgi:hypothetical protein
MQLAKSGDVVEARIGTRIGDHDKAGAYEDSAAISHGFTIFLSVGRKFIAT